MRVPTTTFTELQYVASRLRATVRVAIPSLPAQPGKSLLAARDAVRQEHIRYSGEASGVDQCLARAGYTRRDLTPEEMIALNQSYGSDRLRLLDHLVSGGTLDTLPRPAG